MQPGCAHSSPRSTTTYSQSPRRATTAENGNPLEFPAAALGGRARRARDRPLRHGHAPGRRVRVVLQSQRSYVSLAAPGAGGGGCELGVFSILPANGATEWDDPRSLLARLQRRRRALRLRRGHELRRTVRRRARGARLAGRAAARLGAGGRRAGPLGAPDRQPGWNEFTGAGIVDGKAATTLAAHLRRDSPRARGKARSARQPGDGHARAHDGPHRRGATSSPASSPTGCWSHATAAAASRIVAQPPLAPVLEEVRLRGRKSNVFVATACDGNGNCGVKMLGRFKKRG